MKYTQPNGSLPISVPVCVRQYFQICVCATLLALSVPACLGIGDANWTKLGSGMNDRVYALAVSGSNVYAAGRFTMAGGNSVGCIAKWDGSSWTGLGSGVSGQVMCLAVSGTNLYAGGSFSTAGGISAHNVAKWDGNSWSALGTGIGQYPLYSAEVYAVAVSGSNVYVGGSFGSATVTTVNNIAVYHRGVWSALGSGLNGPVYAIAFSGTNLYAGGGFTLGVSKSIARWNGSSWTALSTGMSGSSPCPVYALAVAGTTLYAGGLFPTAGGVSVADIARWNGNTWAALGSGMSVSANYFPSVYALATGGTNLYAGGDFTRAGGNPANRIAKWDGSAWSALGSGMNTNVRALAVSGNDLYVGGDFTTAAGKTVGFVARVYLPDLPSLSITRSQTNVTLSWPSPNTEDFALQQKENVANTNWVSVSADVSDDGTNKSVSLPATNKARVFRLRRP